MTIDTKSRPKSVNSQEDVPGFPSLKREPVHKFTTADVEWILHGGSREKRDDEGRLQSLETRGPMSVQAAKNWLTGAHARGEIDTEQVWHFWPDDTLPAIGKGEGG